MQFHLFHLINLIYLLLTICISDGGVLSWNLISLGVTDNNYRLQHVSLYFIRAFLCIVNNDNNNNINNDSDNSILSTTTTSEIIKKIPTLIESTWPENLLAIRPKIFPNKNAHALTDDSVTNCEKIHYAKLTDIDDYGRLWVFDAGNKYCNAKILIYDLLQRNKEIFRTNCIGFNGDEVISMKIDPNSSSLYGYYVTYFTLNHGHYMIVFNLKNKKWHKIKVNTGPEWDLKTTLIHELAFTIDYRMYLADNNGNLYIATISGGTTSQMKNRTANITNTVGISTELHATSLGCLLGQPKSLITDPLGALYYVLPKHGVVVRWQPSRTLNAEGHDILHFQSIPIVQIIFGVQGSVWIATERVHMSRDHCYRILYHFSVNSE